MPKEIMESYGVEHPAPHRGLVSDALLFSALLAAPLAWAAQLLLNYALAANACFPRQTPKAAPGPGWEWLHPGLLAVNLIALAVAIAATVVAAALWRRTSQEAHGGHEELIDVGHGRTRFFAVWGVWSGIWFIVQILFGTIAAIGAPGCGS